MFQDKRTKLLSIKLIKYETVFYTISRLKIIPHLSCGRFFQLAGQKPRLNLHSCGEIDPC